MQALLLIPDAILLSRSLIWMSLAGLEVGSRLSEQRKHMRRDLFVGSSSKASVAASYASECLLSLERASDLRRRHAVRVSFSSCLLLAAEMLAGQPVGSL